MSWRMGLAVIAAVLGVADPVLADERTAEGARDEARASGEEGLALFARGEWAAALEKFERAHALYPAPTLGLRRARCLEKLGRWVEAEEQLRKTTEMEVDPTLPDAYRQAQEQARAEAAREGDVLRERIPTLTFVFRGPAPSRVTIDGAPLASDTVHAPARVDPGEHLVRAERGEAHVEARVAVAERDRREVVLRLPEPSPARPPAIIRSPSTEAPAEAALRIAGWVGVAVGGTAVAAGAVQLGLALDRKADLDAVCDTDTRACSEADGGVNESDVDTYNALSIGSTASFIAGGVLSAAGIVMVLVAPELTSEPPAVAPVVLVTPSAGLVAVGGRF